MVGPHDKLIASAAKHVLGPLGLRRKGKSRLWLADHSWWLAVVEFQPSGWAKGSYLNVAAHWLWNAKGHISFDIGSSADGIRRERFIKYVSDAQFEPEAISLARAAADDVQKLRSRLKTIDVVAAILCEEEEARPTASKGSWGAYNAAVALGLSGQLAAAKAIFGSVSDGRVRPDVEVLQQSLGSDAAFREEIDKLIARQRSALGIDPKH